MGSGEQADDDRRVAIVRRREGPDVRPCDSWRASRSRQDGDDVQAPNVTGRTAVGVCERDGAGIDGGRGRGGHARRRDRRRRG